MEDTETHMSVQKLRIKPFPSVDEEAWSTAPKDIEAKQASSISGPEVFREH